MSAADSLRTLDGRALAPPQHFDNQAACDVLDWVADFAFGLTPEEVVIVRQLSGALSVLSPQTEQASE